MKHHEDIERTYMQELKKRSKMQSEREQEYEIRMQQKCEDFIGKWSQGQSLHEQEVAGLSLRTVQKHAELESLHQAHLDLEKRLLDVEERIHSMEKLPCRYPRYEMGNPATQSDLQTRHRSPENSIDRVEGISPRPAYQIGSLGIPRDDPNIVRARVNAVKDTMSEGKGTEDDKERRESDRTSREKPKGEPSMLPRPTPYAASTLRNSTPFKGKSRPPLL